MRTKTDVGIETTRPVATPAAVGTAAAGTGKQAANEDHVHATGAGTPSTQAFGDAAATGSGPAASMTDHKHAMPANPVTSPSSAKMAIWIPASAFSAALTNGPTWSLTESTTNKETFGAWGFNDTTEQSANAMVFIPGWYDSGTMTVKYVWTSASGSNGVTWGCQMMMQPDNAAIDTAYGTEVTTDDTVLTSLYVHMVTSTAITTGGTAGVSRPLWVRVARKVGNANDTKVGDALLLGVYVLYGVTTLINS